MSDTAKQQNEAAEKELLDALNEAETAADEALAAAQDTADEQEAVDPITELEAEVADLKDKLLRTMAEMQNLRRRAEREKSEATLYAATNFARDLLPVGDNLTRALDTMTPEQRENADDAVKNLLEGVELTKREFNNTLHKHNINLIDPMGEKFDPNLHQAMYEIPDPDAINGTVVQVVQPGYSIGERVLRPAMVGVAKSDKK